MRAKRKDTPGHTHILPLSVSASVSPSCTLEGKDQGFYSRFFFPEPQAERACRPAACRPGAVPLPCLSGVTFPRAGQLRHGCPVSPGLPPSLSASPPPLKPTNSSHAILLRTHGLGSAGSAPGEPLLARARWLPWLPSPRVAASFAFLSLSCTSPFLSASGSEK